MDIRLKERVKEFLEGEVSEAYRMRHLSGFVSWTGEYNGEYSDCKDALSFVVDYLTKRNMKPSTRIFNIGKIETNEILGIIFGDEKVVQDGNLPRQGALETKAFT